MRAITAVSQYLETDYEIFLEGETGLIPVPKDKDFGLEFGERIEKAKVKRIDTDKDSNTVTIYL